MLDRCEIPGQRSWAQAEGLVDTRCSGLVTTHGAGLDHSLFSPMIYHLLADLVLVMHAAFIAFVIAGALLALRWRLAALIHLPAALWGAGAELLGWSCPLTPLENHLRHAAGLPAYEGNFIARYLLPLVYPEALTREIQIVLGALVVAVNLLLYAWVWRRRRPTSGP